MSYPAQHYQWLWKLKSSPEAIWPLIADTNRFNLDAGLPYVERVNVPAHENPTGSQRLRLSFAGMDVEWDEQPFEWVRPYRFGVIRTYRSGPIHQLRTFVQLKANEGGGTDLSYEVDVTPKNLVGRFLVPLQVGILTAKKFEAVVREYDKISLHHSGIAKIISKKAHHPFDEIARVRISNARPQLLTAGIREEHIRRLLEFIENSDDLTLSRLRPYAIADLWKQDRHEILKVFLHATRAGLFQLRWNLLCPMCRGASESALTLADVHSKVHCESCHIDFNVNFDESVELTFSPSPVLRKISIKEYCIGGPEITPHILVQQTLKPGEIRDIQLPLENGSYRVRSPGTPNPLMIQALQDGGENEIVIERDAELKANTKMASKKALFRFNNLSDHSELFLLERTAWNDQVVTAADVTSLQTFRDLFSTEALRPGEQISVGSLTILFTDLRDSTKLYRDIGDAPAFGCVMNHFDLIRSMVAKHEGAIVKTIGDAVMAVFTSPVNSLKAVMDINAALKKQPIHGQSLVLKAGVHYGSCIAVNLNQRLDYFGSSVNIAARLVSLSKGEDVVLSNSIQNDPEVQRYLDQETGLRSRIEPLQTTLKGFDAAQFTLFRLPTG